MKNFLIVLGELTKIRITLFVTLSTIFGYIFAAGILDWKGIIASVGVLLLSCGSAALNHYQEREYDALMERTMNRPIPSKRISAVNALIISIFLIISGTIILFSEINLLTASIGLLTLFWYNAIYTPLKRKNSLAILPGSVIGALPPVIGWISGGGHLLDTQIIIIAAFFFLWQIPHFWILLLTFGNDYQRAGFPVITKYITNKQLLKITSLWSIAVALTSLLLPFFDVVQLSLTSYLLLFAALWFIYSSLKIYSQPKLKEFSRLAFRGINLFVLEVVLIVSLEKLIIFF